EHRQAQRHQDEETGDERAEDDGSDQENHPADLKDVENLSLDHHLIHRRGDRRPAADFDLDLVSERFGKEGLELSEERLKVGAAIGLEKDPDVHQPVTVIDVAVEISGLSRHRVKEKILRNQIAAL